MRLPTALHKQASEIAIYDALGQKVLQKELQVSRNEEGTAVKLLAMPKGLYTLQVATETGLVSKKLVIE